MLPVLAAAPPECKTEDFLLFGIFDKTARNREQQRDNPTASESRCADLCADPACNQQNEWKHHVQSLTQVTLKCCGLVDPPEVALMNLNSVLEQHQLSWLRASCPAEEIWTSTMVLVAVAGGVGLHSAA